MMGFFQRVAPAVITTELMRDFNISASALGNLSAFYFYSYVAMQVPTGIFADRWGPRRLLTTGALVAGAGTILFALAPALIWANAGRLLIGGSVAVAFVGLLKVADNWFPARYYAMVSGMALFCGTIGAVFAGTPLRLLVNLLTWRNVMLMAAAVTFIICAAIWIFVRDYPHEKGYQDFNRLSATPVQVRSRTILSGIFEVLTYRNTLLLCGISSAMVGCVLTFAGLWGVPYLSTHLNLSPARAALLTSALLISWAVGGPACGWLSDRIGRRKPLMIGGCALSLCGWIAICFWPNLPAGLFTTIVLLTGLSSGSMIISFAFAKESVPPELSGTVSGVVNMGTMMGPMVLQPAVGWILDQQWQGTMDQGVRIYSLQAYQYGFSLMIAWNALALFLLLLTRETRCRQL
jgi:MFS family permease